MTLISAHELAERLNDDAPIVVCDVRFHLADFDQGRREYDAGHLPGAVFVDLHHDLAGGPGGGRHPLPTVASFVDLIGGMGISPGTMVVAYLELPTAIPEDLWKHHFAWL